MIIALKKDIRKEEQDRLIAWLESYGVRTHISEGEYQTVVWGNTRPWSAW